MKACKRDIVIVACGKFCDENKRISTRQLFEICYFQMGIPEEDLQDRVEFVWREWLVNDVLPDEIREFIINNFFEGELPNDFQ